MCINKRLIDCCRQTFRWYMSTTNTSTNITNQHQHHQPTPAPTSPTNTNITNQHQHHQPTPTPTSPTNTNITNQHQHQHHQPTPTSPTNTNKSNQHQHHQPTPASTPPTNTNKNNFATNTNHNSCCRHTFRWYMSPSQVNGYYAPRQNRIGEWSAQREPCSQSQARTHSSKHLERDCDLAVSHETENSSLWPVGVLFSHTLSIPLFCLSVFLAGILQNPFYNKKFPK